MSPIVHRRSDNRPTERSRVLGAWTASVRRIGLGLTLAFSPPSQSLRRHKSMTRRSWADFERVSGPGPLLAGLLPHHLHKKVSNSLDRNVRQIDDGAFTERRDDFISRPDETDANAHAVGIIDHQVPYAVFQFLEERLDLIPEPVEFADDLLRSGLHVHGASGLLSRTY